jgi:glycosyltransferase involved in cell wall biosynthesis
MIVGGFPNPDQPHRGIFNLHAAQALSALADLRVVFLRAWKPGRRLISISSTEGVTVTTLAVPQLIGTPSLNAALYRYLGWPLLRSLLRSNCDIVHSVDVTVGIVASFWARRARIHHVTQAIGSDINSILPRIRGRLGVDGWERHLHGVACNSQALADAFLRLYPSAQNVRTIYRGVDLERCNPHGAALGPLAESPPVRFLFLGGFPPYPTLPYRSNTKGGETLLGAWQVAEINFGSRPASLLIAGQASDSQRLVRWRAALRHPDRVHLAGVLPPAEIPAYIRSSDVVLQPSMQEGLPNVAMEAAACARAVFGSMVGGIPEVLKHGETGLLLPPGDVTAWANALVEYSTHAATLERMGKRAREVVALSFDRRQYAPQMLDLYAAALREPHDY